MRRRLKRLLVGLILSVLPVGVVLSLQHSSWGPVLATPSSRQMGAPLAKVKITIFSDFQCPMCARVEPYVQELQKRYGDRTRWIFKYMPLIRIHPNAMPAAHAAECAAAQDKFWPYQERLFATQDLWAPLSSPTTFFVTLAREVGLDSPRFERCLADPSRQAVILQDVQEARQRQVNATPTFLVNEERLVGNVFMAEGAATIERQLRQ